MVMKTNIFYVDLDNSRKFNHVLYPNFNHQDIKIRILSYPYLYEILYEKQIKVIVTIEDMKPNLLKLKFVFRIVRM